MRMPWSVLPYASQALIFGALFALASAELVSDQLGIPWALTVVMLATLGGVLGWSLRVLYASRPPPGQCVSIRAILGVRAVNRDPCRTHRGCLVSVNWVRPRSSERSLAASTRGNTTTFTYDALGNTLTETDPLNDVRSGMGVGA
jgi:YD repeat-containing protein